MPSIRSVLGTTAVVAAACASHPPEESAATTVPSSPVASAAGQAGDTVKIWRGQSGVVDGGRLVIHVDSASDSRCPKDVQCVWGGEVAVSVRLETGGATTAAAIHMVREPRQATAGPYAVRVADVTSYPGTEPPNARLAQVVSFVVTRR